jgi:hypothetical protein
MSPGPDRLAVPGGQDGPEREQTKGGTTMPIQYGQGDVLLVRARVRRWERLRRVEPADGRIVLAGWW